MQIGVTDRILTRYATRLPRLYQNLTARYLVEWWMASELTRSEVQVLRLGSTVDSDTLTGTFRLSWGEGGEETDHLPVDVGEVDLEAALEALRDIRDVQVWVALGPREPAQ